MPASRCVCFALALLAPPVLSAGSGDEIASIQIEVKGHGRAARQPIAVPDPRLLGLRSDSALPRAASDLVAVLRDDLKYSGVFDLVDSSFHARVPTTTPDKVPYDEWNAVGAAFLVLVDVTLEQGSLVTDGRLYETRTDRKLILAKRYTAAKLEDARYVAHRLADAVIGQVGGEPGVCQSQLVFVSDRDGGRGREVYVMDYDGFNQRRVTSDRVLTYAPDWSPSNEQIVYTSFLRRNPDLYVLNRGGGSSRALFARSGMNSSPAWSPDGKLIAFASSSDGGDAEIYTIQPDGQGLKRLTENRGIDTSPAWSPGGREIAFTSDRSGRPDLWMMDADGLNVRRLLAQKQVAFNDGAAFAPRGKGARLAFAGMTLGQFQIFIYTIDTGEVVQLTRDGSNETPTWSADGRQLAFASTRGAKSDIWVVNDDGENLRRITQAGGNVSPDWSNR